MITYGTLRLNQGNWAWALQGRSDYIGTITVDGYDMFSVSDSFPACVKGHGSILVDAFKIDDEVFKEIDGLEGYPNMYTRELVTTIFGDAWIYIWNRDLRNMNQIFSGDWVAYLDENRKAHGAMYA